jgi:hypothetical protein
MWAVARGQLVNPMNIMLLMVVRASFAIVQIATALGAGVDLQMITGDHTITARAIVVATDKLIQLSRQRKAHRSGCGANAHREPS